VKKSPRSVAAPSLAFLKGKSILVTGGTGSFGQKFIKTVLEHSEAARVIVFSRDEFKQSQMASQLHDKRLRFFVGDVRDLPRLQRAFHGVDYVVHAAALKQVPTLEYNPFEAVLTNVIGGQNVINAAIDQGVARVVALSTDKAANPINLYGATKLCAEKLFVAGNSYASGRSTQFCVVRYGNVVGSRGSVVPLYQERRKSGVLPVTDERMTRFWITLDQGVAMVLTAFNRMVGGEVFVPKIPSMRILDLAKAMAPECKIEIIGIRPGEKLHEALLTEDEACRAYDHGDCYVIEPALSWWTERIQRPAGARPVAPDFRYSSETNDQWLTPEQLAEMIDGRVPSSVKA
jgi:UDP-N-acetylglucosamine 4,6-dehydratase